MLTMCTTGGEDQRPLYVLLELLHTRFQLQSIDGVIALGFRVRVRSRFYDMVSRARVSVRVIGLGLKLATMCSLSILVLL